MPYGQVNPLFEQSLRNYRNSMVTKVYILFQKQTIHSALLFVILLHFGSIIEFKILYLLFVLCPLNIVSMPHLSFFVCVCAVTSEKKNCLKIL